MKGLLIVLPFLLGCLEGRGQQPRVPAPNSVRAALEAQYAKIAAAYDTDAPEAILDLRTPDFEVQMPNGERWDAERSAAYIRAGFQQVERTLDLAFTIEDLEVRGDTATAWIHQEWSRVQRMQGRLRRVETSACQLETWIRTGSRWMHRGIEGIQPLVWKVGRRPSASRRLRALTPGSSPDTCARGRSKACVSTW